MGTANRQVPQIPYEYLTPLQAAIGVVQKGIRPMIPKDTHPKLIELLQKCCHRDPAESPGFSEILEILQKHSKDVRPRGSRQNRVRFSCSAEEKPLKE